MNGRAAVFALLPLCAALLVAAAPVHASALTLDVRDQPVRDVLLRIGAAGRLDIAVADDLRGTISLSLHGASASDAVRAVCTQLQLRCTWRGRMISVSTAASAVLPLVVVRPARVQEVLRAVLPALSVRAAPDSNAVVLSGTAADVQAARGIVTALDVRDPSKATIDAIVLRAQLAPQVAAHLQALYPAAKISALSKTTLLVNARPADQTQIKNVLSAADAPSPAPTPRAVTTEAVKVVQRRPHDVARAVGAQVPHLRVGVSGSAVTLSGAPEDVARAKVLVAQLDLPPFGTRYTQIYRLRNVDAASVAELVRRAFADATVTVDASLNALSVTATAGDQQRIADGVAQLDGTAAQQPGTQNFGGAGVAFSGHEIVQLRSILPGQGAQSGTSSAQDIAQAVSQALQGSAGDLRITVPNGSQSLILTGSPQAVRAAKELIAELDVVPQSVVLDTEILELDENSSRDLGLQLGTTAIGTTFSEMQPPLDQNGQPGRIMRFQTLTRTGIQFQAQLNLLVQNGRARVLADPRITTVSGRMATIRAGDTISILTTVGGGTGTIATTQLQSFQTGVTLDITPLVTKEGELNVAMHPVVNSLSGYLNGVPEISTRDTQTTVHLRDDETLVIGGLIQESMQNTESKIPIVGDIPLVGRIFRNEQRTNTRNELVIVVTPHLLKPGATTSVPNAAVPSSVTLPTPRPLPTVPPGVAFPQAAPRAAPMANAPSTWAAATPTPMPAPDAVAAISPEPSASAHPTPSAFAQANVYVYGSPPPSTFAAPGDAPKIFYAMLQPSLLSANATARISAITTTNVQRLAVGFGGTAVNLAPLANGTWQGVFSANNLGLPATTSSMQLTLTAYGANGQTASIPIAVNVVR
ncbi:MAG: hypothetical protein JOZ24_08385 [Candidatus Eremiobacteraeota bacterium]|nr:hypothetical protein [Candidatus Eremiobacteraeota bacterium]